MSSSPSSPSSSSSAPAILLLKTKSTPHDGYADFFSARGFAPTFVPVLEHRLHEQNLRRVHELFASGAFGHIDSDSTRSDGTGNGESANGKARRYGGLIFTSQRSVEGFAKMLDDAEFSFYQQPHPPPILYTVGPATARALTSLRDTHLPPALIHGADAGTGENLAHSILEHYNTLYPSPPGDSASTSEGVNGNGNGNTKTKPALLFLVGEQRRDIIPKTLMSPSLTAAQRIPVEEIVVYETCVMDSFEEDFRAAVARTYRTTTTEHSTGDGYQTIPWVVVFSPTGCEAMLRVLGMGPFRSDDTERPFRSDIGPSGTTTTDTRRGTGAAAAGVRRAYIATIGPTTRDYLRTRFGFEVDVCAGRPSPEGVGDAIDAFMREKRA